MCGLESGDQDVMAGGNASVKAGVDSVYRMAGTFDFESDHL
jgi:hypothetical protein